MVNAKVLTGTLSLAAMGVAGLVWANWSRGVTVVVRNIDSACLSGVVIHVTGRDYPIGDMPPGSTRSVLVDPTGESHVEISLQHGGERERRRAECYFEAGYSGSIAIEISRAAAVVVENHIAVGIW